jgi:RNA polymerase sigma-70 factor (ECF subfamily)
VALPPDELESLLSRAGDGDEAAQARLLQAHRPRLRRMVASRLDRRLTARTDPSDIVQDALLVAHQRLPEYLRARPLPFYPWLRQLAIDQLIRHLRMHLGARARSVLREEGLEPGISEASANALAGRLSDSVSMPEAQLQRREERARIKEALARLSPQHREVLVLRFLDELSLAEVSAVLRISETAVRGRQFRAIQRLQSLLGKPEQ